MRLDPNRSFTTAIVALLACGVLTLSGAASPVRAQARGELAFDPARDAGFLTLRGTEGRNACRLLVDGSENTRGRLLLYDDGAERASLYVDGASQGGARIRNSSGTDGAVLFVDDGTDHGILRLHAAGGQERVRLAVDGGGGRGNLVLEGSTNAERARVYVDGLDQGGVRVRNSSGGEAGVLFVDDDTDHGILRLRASGGQVRARLAVIGGGRGDLRLDASDSSERVRAYVDGLDQGGVRVRGGGGTQAAVLFVDDDTDHGVLRLHESGGQARARLAVIGSGGRGELRLEGATNAERVRVYVDAQNQGGARIRNSAGQPAAVLYVDDVTDNGVLRLHEIGGQERARLAVIGSEGNGRGNLLLRGSANSERAHVYVDSLNQGGARIRNSGGGEAAILFVDDTTDHPALRMREAEGSVRALLEVDPAAQGDLALGGVDSFVRAQVGLQDDDHSGFMELRGQRVAEIVRAERATATEPNDGALRVFGTRPDGAAALRGELLSDPAGDGGLLVLYDHTGAPTIVLDGRTGVISKVALNGFRIPHPRQADKEIFYVSLEGPEAGIYVRGTARLREGRAVVELPEHFATVAREGSLSVQLTPASAETMGLAVIQKSPRSIEVRELANGRGDFAFDFVVFATRGDIDPVAPVRDRSPARLETGPAGRQAIRLEAAAEAEAEPSEEVTGEDAGAEEEIPDRSGDPTDEVAPGDETSDEAPTRARPAREAREGGDESYSDAEAGEVEEEEEP